MSSEPDQALPPTPRHRQTFFRTAAIDAYSKLREVADVEQCQCRTVSGLLLVYLFTRNPIHCATCREQIDPERLGLTLDEVDDISACFGDYASLYDLWLHSGEYDAFAKAKLTDPRGQVNRSGMSVAKRLSERWPTYYWWFHDTDDGIPDRCPSCGALLDRDVQWGTGKCDLCRVLR